MRALHTLVLASTIGLAGPTLADDAITLNVAGEFAGAPFSCAQTYAGIGASNATVEVTDYRLFVSNVALITADGKKVPLALDQDGAWQFGPVALLDFEDGTGPCANGTAATNSTIVGTAPAGRYTGVAFTVGVPFSLNHGDPTLAASPLNLTAMFWNWRAGYKFVKVDLARALPDETDAAGPEKPPASQRGGHSPRAECGATCPAAAVSAAGHRAIAKHHAASPPSHRARGWSLHLGSTLCASASRTSPPSACQNPNRVDVVLTGFDAAQNTIVIDPAAVIAAANVEENAPGTSPGCMSFPNDADCDTVLPRLGMASGGAEAMPQQLVTMR